MSFWQSGFWADDFWAPEFWEGEAAPAVDGPRRSWRGLMKTMAAQGTTVEQVSGNPGATRWVAPK